MPTSLEQHFFGKHQRLLTASEYKAVFDGACYKSSHRYLLLLARPNQLPSGRLGTVVSKKNARLAVQRNRLKRLLREQFRLSQRELAGLDIIALVKPGLWQQDNATIVGLINQQWARLIEQQRKQAGPGLLDVQPLAERPAGATSPRVVRQDAAP